MKRTCSIAARIALCFLVSGAPATASQTAEAPRPNLLLAIADDWGFPHAGEYADPVVRTPNFDRLAREGLRFSRAFCSSPSCTPSRGAILTGQHFWRLEEGANLWSTLPARFPVYPELLEQAGYFVGHTRKGWGPGQLGERKRNPAGPEFKNFEQFLGQRPKGQPFCFWFGSQDPHRPYEPGTGLASGMDPAKIQLPAHLPDSEEVRSDVADYYFEVQRFDREVGGLIQRLQAIGELDQTIVVMTADHGMPFPRAKANLYDAGTRVPLAIRWGEKIPRPGRVVTEFVNLADLAPTFLEAAGVAVPKEMTASSLLSIITSDDERHAGPERDHVIFGRERHTQAQEAPDGGGYPSRALRTSRYLYIRNFAPARRPAGTANYLKSFLDRGWLGDCDNGPSKFYMWQHRNEASVRPHFARAFDLRPAEELYDLDRDPDQLDNVAGDPDHEKTRRELSEQLMAELKAGGDPRVAGGGDKFDRYPYYGGVPTWPW
ncbi:MAG TPA: sulfatase [Pirellulales bacterium]|nr:sulfatase [Pirellulales bacterium]